MKIDGFLYLYLIIYYIFIGEIGKMHYVGFVVLLLPKVISEEGSIPNSYV